MPIAYVIVWIGKKDISVHARHKAKPQRVASLWGFLFVRVNHSQASYRLLIIV